jgi:hypothetical protein
MLTLLVILKKLFKKLFLKNYYMLYVGKSLSLDFRPFWIFKPPSTYQPKGISNPERSKSRPFP